MKPLTPYLNFDGNAREAMSFYQKCLGGAELMVMTFAEAIPDSPPSAKNRLMHAHLSKGNLVLMASDTMPGMDFRQGNNAHINMACDSVEEIERLFAAFAEGGKITMPLQETFWAFRFGMLTDRFGIGWMFNLEKPH